MEGRNSAHLCVGLSVAALVAAIPVAAAGQDLPAETAADRADSRLSRLEQQDRDFGPIRVSGAAPGVTPPFSLRVSLPFTYNTNVGNFENGGKDDFHATPSVRLDYSRPTGAFVVYARAAADGDIYIDYDDSNASTLSGRLGIRWEEPGLGPLKPYFQYSPTIIYSGGFSDSAVTLHDLTVGVGGAIPLNNITFAFDLQGTRREATLPGSEQDRVRLGLNFSGSVTRTIAWSIDQTAARRDYTGGANDGRCDTNLLTVAGISAALNPEAAASGAAAIFLHLNVSYERNLSNRDGKDYSVWDIGPTLTLRTAF